MAHLTEEQKQLYRLYYVTTKIYERALLSNVGFGARYYLKKRNITLKTAKEYHLGYAPGFDYLKKSIKKYHFSNYLMRKSGLFCDNARQDGLRDRFYQRLMFPITDKYGYTISFSGRRLEQHANNVKYMVTPNSSIAKKRNEVFGFHNALPTINRKKTIFIVEGNFDVLAMHQAGIHNTIATLGCNLMPPQIKLIRPLVNNIILCYDGDKPGQQGICKGMKNLFWTHIKIWGVRWPNHYDPAFFYKIHRAKNTRAYILAKYLPAVQFLMQHEIDKVSIFNHESMRRMTFLNYSIKIILKYISSPKLQYQWLKYLAQKENIKVSDMINSVRELKKKRLY